MNKEEWVSFGFVYKASLYWIVSNIFDVVAEITFVGDDVVIERLLPLEISFHSRGIDTSAMHIFVDVPRTVDFDCMHNLGNVCYGWLYKDMEMVRHNDIGIQYTPMDSSGIPNRFFEHGCKIVIGKKRIPFPYICCHEIDGIWQICSLKMLVDHRYKENGLETLPLESSRAHPSPQA